MPNLLDALSDSENTIDLQDENLITPIHEFLEINPEKRLIIIPESEQLFGVYGENKVEIKYFKCPRIILNDIDLYECYIFINYISASGKIGYIQADTVVLDETEDYIIFTWELTRNVFDENIDTDIYFSISAKQYLEDKEPVFFTRKAKGNLYETVYAEEQITEQYADIILQLLAEMDGVKQIATPEAINVQKVDCVVDVESDSIGIIDIGCLPSNFGVGDYIIDSEETIWKITSIDSNAIVKLTTDDISQVTKNTIKIDKLSQTVNDMKENGTGGWTTEQIDLFDSLLNYIPFNNPVAGTIADSLVASLRKNNGGTTDEPVAEMYTITRTLENCTSSSEIASIVEGVSHSETFIPNDGYTLDGAEIIVTMGGTDISSSYADGVLSIGSVTGNIEITVKAKETNYVLYELPQATSFSATTDVIDTGAILFDENKGWSIAFDVSIDSTPNVTTQIWHVSQPKNVYGNNALGFQLRPTDTAKTIINGLTKTLGSAVWLGEKAGNTAKVVMTHAIDSDSVVTSIHQQDIAGKDEMVNDIVATPSDGYPQSDQPVIIGEINTCAVTFNDFKIYSRVLTAEEINTYLA